MDFSQANTEKNLQLIEAYEVDAVDMMSQPQTCLPTPKQGLNKSQSLERV
jgi:hypothetical protein